MFSEEDGYGTVVSTQVNSVSVRFEHGSGVFGSKTASKRRYARTFVGDEVLILVTSEQMKDLRRNRNRSGDGKTNIAFRRKRLDMDAQAI